MPIVPAGKGSHPFTRIAYSLLVIFGILLVGAVIFHYFERLSWLDSFYFATITLTTIGYGDITPTQDATKVFVIFYALSGVATVLFLMTNVARYYIEIRERQFENRFAGLKDTSLHKGIRQVHHQVRRLHRHISSIPDAPKTK